MCPPQSPLERARPWGRTHRCAPTEGLRTRGVEHEANMHFGGPSDDGACFCLRMSTCMSASNKRARRVFPMPVAYGTDVVGPDRCVRPQSVWVPDVDVSWRPTSPPPMGPVPGVHRRGGPMCPPQSPLERAGPWGAHTGAPLQKVCGHEAWSTKRIDVLGEFENLWAGSQPSGIQPHPVAAFSFASVELLISSVHHILGRFARPRKSASKGCRHGDTLSLMIKPTLFDEHS